MRAKVWRCQLFREPPGEFPVCGSGETRLACGCSWILATSILQVTSIMPVIYLRGRHIFNDRHRSNRVVAGMEIKEAKWVCLACAWCGVDSALLVAPNPFDTNLWRKIRGCPACREIESFRMACDSHGCWLLVEAATPTPEGPRYTCREHA